ncbi:hypothetical protein QYM36_000154 [Artemia franciscana]|uniref:Uncharacterized protein n=1 Tax=Artemia franciscana TaxID=6661 RepID=A0AA88IPR9_ARTSF|nr:hypothetical protein QYM36_000154 [Artemia franciscana]
MDQINSKPKTKIETLLIHQRKRERPKFETTIIGGLQEITDAKVHKENRYWRNFKGLFKKKKKNKKLDKVDMQKGSEAHKSNKTENRVKATKPEKRNNIKVIPVITLNKTDAQDIQQKGIFLQNKENSKPDEADAEKVSEAHKCKKTKNRRVTTEPEERNDIIVIPVSTPKKTDVVDVQVATKRDVKENASSIIYPDPQALPKSKVMHISQNKCKGTANLTICFLVSIDILLES